MLLVAVLSVLLVAVAAQPRFEAAKELVSRVDQLEAGAADAKSRAPEFIRRAKAVESRVSRLEDDGCGEGREFQCGGYERRCLSDLLVCDGKNDCMDGQDEDADLCRSRVPAGAIFEGTLARRRQGGCGADIRSVRMTIVWSQRLSWFQSRQKVKAAITITSGKGTEQGAIVRGYYNYRLKSVILLPMEDLPARLGISCTFDGVQDDRCMASVRSADLEPCISFGMKKIN